MRRDPDATVVVARFCDELSAILLVSELESHGIKATVIGGLIAQLRVKAPGLVSVLVRQGDVERARELMTPEEPPPGWEDEAERMPREDE